MSNGDRALIVVVAVALAAFVDWRFKALVEHIDGVDHVYYGESRVDIEDVTAAQAEVIEAVEAIEDARARIRGMFADLAKPKPRQSPEPVAEPDPPPTFVVEVVSVAPEEELDTFISTLHSHKVVLRFSLDGDPRGVKAARGRISYRDVFGETRERGWFEFVALAPGEVRELPETLYENTSGTKPGGWFDTLTVERLRVTFEPDAVLFDDGEEWKSEK